MKKVKLITSLFLVLAMVLSLGAFALAGTQTGSITIKDPLAKQSYYVYRIFDLESYNKKDNNYSYTLNSTWQDFALQETIRGHYITLEESGDKYYVKWIEGADVTEFAKLAIDWAKAHTDSVSISDGVSTLGTDEIVFENLPLGYYLVDSSVGALCALTTTDPDATVIEKNELTTVVKLVKENSTNDYVAENSAKVGDTVSFKSEITLGDGVENLVLHDVMDASLSLQKDTVKVYVQQNEVNKTNYTLNSVYIDDNNVFHSLDDRCTFEISFDNDYIATLNKGTVIRVEYDAVVKWNVKEPKSFGNEAWVAFGDDLTSTHSSTTTNTYGFDLVKTDDKGVAIQTAEFYLYDSQKDGNVIPVIALSEDEESGVYRYRVATPDDTVIKDGDAIKAGYAYIYGLDKQVYYLEETQQPDGFNLLSERVKVDLSNGDITADTSGDFFKDGSVLGNVVTDAGGVQVVNKSGTVLPSTGSIGTILFYVLGGLLVAIPGVALITMRRMNNKNN